MQLNRILLATSALAFGALAIAQPADAARSKKIVVSTSSSSSSSSTSVGNSVSITIKNGTTVVKKTESCSPGVTGYIVQSITVLFGGGYSSSTQKISCP